MEYMQTHMAETMIVLGLALLAIEIAVLGFSTFFLFFVGLGAVATGILFLVGVPETLVNALLGTAILTAISAAVLWRPLKDMQLKTETKKAKSDLIDMEFELLEDVEPGKTTHFRFSGIDWQLKSANREKAGTRVKVTDVEVGVMHITAVDEN